MVNEAVDNVTGVMRETPLSKAMGSPDKVLEVAFRAARANLPDTELVYNDYMGWERDNAPHRDGVLRLLERFRKNGVPVNALGIQGHIGAGNQDSNNNRAFDARDEKAWRKFLEEVTGMGYSLLITEFDVHDAPLPADFAARDRAVAALGRGFLDLTLSFTPGERRGLLGPHGHAHLAAGPQSARRRPAQASHALRRSLSTQAAARSHCRRIPRGTAAQTRRHRGYSGLKGVRMKLVSCERAAAFECHPRDPQRGHRQLHRAV